MNQGSYFARIIYDQNGIPCDYMYIDINPLFEQILGLSKDQIIGKTYNELIPPDPSSGWLDCFIKVASTGIPDSFIFYSTIFQKYFETYAFLPSKGIFAVLVNDITIRKKAELEREHFFKFFSNSRDIMAIVDPNGYFKRVNPYCIQLMGYSEAELLSKPYSDFVHPDDLKKTIDEALNHNKQDFTPNFENRYICKDGTILWLSWHSSFSDEDGITYASALDITQKKQDEEELKKSEERFKTIFYQAPLGIALIDSFTGQIYEANP